MKKIPSSIWLLLGVLLCSLVFCKHTAIAQARTVRLFLIGNSFSQNATVYLPRLAKEGGHELIIGRAQLGGASLRRHWEAVEAAEADPSKGKIYGGKSLRERLSNGTWDIVTIQQASIYSSDVDSYRPYAQKLHDFIKTLQPQAEVVMHQTWAYRSDAAIFGFTAPGVPAKNDAEMWENLNAAYHTVAAELGVRLIPVGAAFRRASTVEKWAYKKDAGFDFANPVFPNLPDQTNSLHVGYEWSKQKFVLDANHANSAGCYLGALVWYGFLFDESPEKVTFVPEGLTAPFAAFLRQTAALTLQKKLVE